jgi:hypothetical protein
MFRSPYVRIGLAVVAVIAALGVLRLKPWQALRGGDPSGERQQLTVGFLPVT